MYNTRVRNAGEERVVLGWRLQGSLEGIVKTVDVTRITDRITGPLCKVYNLGIPPTHTIVSHRQYHHIPALYHVSA